METQPEITGLTWGSPFRLFILVPQQPVARKQAVPVDADAERRGDGDGADIEEGAGDGAPVAAVGEVVGDAEGLVEDRERDVDGVEPVIEAGAASEGEDAGE